MGDLAFDIAAFVMLTCFAMMATVKALDIGNWLAALTFVVTTSVDIWLCFIGGRHA